MAGKWANFAMSSILCLVCFQQVALANALGMMNDEEQVLRRVKATVQHGSSSKLVGSRHNVRLLPCMRYNYCHCAQNCCTDPARLPFSLTTADELSDARVKVLRSPIVNDMQVRWWL